jgi:hypothetical protein
LDKVDFHVRQHVEKAFQKEQASHEKPQDCGLGRERLIDAKINAEPQWLADVRCSPFELKCWSGAY